MFSYIKSFFQALNANAHPGDVAHAAALGLLLALVPKANLLWAFLFFLTMFIRVNKGSFFLSLILLSFVAPLLDPALEALGYGILTLSPLQGAYRVLYETPFIGLTRFNNSVVAGSFAAGIVLYVPAYLLFRFLVTGYRGKLQPKIVNSKAYKVFLNLPLIKQILNAPSLGGFDK
jgi:uncharacterized protein (TIGR03546 family)